MVKETLIKPGHLNKDHRKLKKEIIDKKNVGVLGSMTLYSQKELKYMGLELD